MTYFLEDVSLWFELFALAASILFLKKGDTRPFLPLKVLLLLVVVVEISATTLRIFKVSNTYLYNWFLIVWVELIFLAFFRMVERPRFKKGIAFFMAFFLVFALFDFSTFGIGLWLAHRSFIAGAILLSVSAIFSMIELVSKPVFLDITKEPIFWISIAVLCYFIPMSIFLGANEYFKGNPSPFGNLYFRSFIRSINILNIIHYSLLSFAFFCHFRKQKSSVVG